MKPLYLVLGLVVGAAVIWRYRHSLGSRTHKNVFLAPRAGHETFDLQTAPR